MSVRDMPQPNYMPYMERVSLKMNALVGFPESVPFSIYKSLTEDLTTDDTIWYTETSLGKKISNEWKEIIKVNQLFPAKGLGDTLRFRSISNGKIYSFEKDSILII